MKKSLIILTIFLSLSLMVSLSGCTNSKDTSSNKPTTTKTSEAKTYSTKLLTEAEVKQLQTDPIKLAETFTVNDLAISDSDGKDINSLKNEYILLKVASSRDLETEEAFINNVKASVAKSNKEKTKIVSETVDKKPIASGSNKEIVLIIQKLNKNGKELTNVISCGVVKKDSGLWFVDTVSSGKQ